MSRPAVRLPTGSVGLREAFCALSTQPRRKPHASVRETDFVMSRAPGNLELQKILYSFARRNKLREWIPPEKSGRSPGWAAAFEEKSQSQSTVNWVVTVRVRLPLLAMIVIEYVPLGVVLPAVTVRTDEPEVLIELTLSVADSPFTSVIPSRIRFAVPLKFSGVTARLYVALPPGLTVSSALSIVSQKSVPAAVRLQAAPGEPDGALKLELESSPVALCHPEKLSFVPDFGLGTVKGVVEFDAFHQVFFDELSVL